jgi:hypothetical protein
MSLGRLFLIVSALWLYGCAGTATLPVDEGIPHDEIVLRLQKLLKEEAVSWDMVANSETKLSASRTELRYGHITPRPAPSLYTPAVVYDWTVIDVDTSQPGYVTISVKSYSPGNFINERLYERESKITEALASLRGRANSALQRTPASGRR